MKKLSYLTQQPSLSISVGRLFTFTKSFYFQFGKVKLNCSSSSSTHNGIGNPDPSLFPILQKLNSPVPVPCINRIGDSVSSVSNS
jgi:hypothetical protein